MDRSPEKVSDVLAQVENLLSVGKPQHAVELIRHVGTDWPPLRNAYGVALMRSGEHAKAVDVYRSICVNESGFCLRAGVPTIFKTNYATALLLNRNVLGCIKLLSEIREKQHPSVIRLRAAVAGWKRSLSLWERLSFILLGGVPARPISLGFLPGELNVTNALRPAA